MRWIAAACAAVAWYASAAAVCPAAPGGSESGAPSRTIVEAFQRYEASRAKVEAELGADMAADIHRRLFDDLALAQTPAPERYAPADWAETVGAVRALDVEAVDQLVAGAPAPLRAVTGLHEFLVPSRVDKTWQLLRAAECESAPRAARRRAAR